jgi:hypothetical protein
VTDFTSLFFKQETYMNDKNQMLMDSILENGFEFKVQNYYQSAFDFMKKHFIVMLAFTAFYFLVELIFFSQRNQILAFFQMILLPPLTAGFYYIIRQKDLMNDVNFEDYFKGYKQIFNFALASILQSIFMIMAFGYPLLKLFQVLPPQEGLNFEVSKNIELLLMICILPGLYLLVSSIFIYPFIAFRWMNTFQAMEASRQMVWKNFLKVFVFCFFLVMLNMLGFSAFGIGILFTFPMSFAAVYFAFKDIVPIQDSRLNIDFKDNP